MQQQQQQQQSQGYWRSAGLIGIILGTVGFYEPAKDVYMKFSDPDFKEVESVALAKQQQRLQQKNLVCATSMARRAVEGEHQTSLRYGVCDNHDVLVEVYPENQPAFQQWVSPENIVGETGQSKSGGLFSSAFAATLLAKPATESMSRPAQMQLKTVCQAWQDATRQVKMIRVTDEGGTCYRERINVLSGRVEIREKVACDTKCDLRP